MQIGDQGNLQSVMSAAAFGRGDIPGCCVEFFGVKKSIKTMDFFSIYVIIELPNFRRMSNDI